MCNRVEAMTFRPADVWAWRLVVLGYLRQLWVIMYISRACEIKIKILNVVSPT